MHEEPRSLDRREPEEVAQFRAAVSEGRPWHLALLEAIGKWALAEEEVEGRRYRYLLLGEAFDWLLLAERLCASANSLIPDEEQERLLFEGLLPAEVGEGELRGLLGSTKYSGLLNYWYGVVVEEALQLVAEEEVRKEHRGRGLPDSEDFPEEGFRRLYGDTKSNLLKLFRKEMGYPSGRSASLTELKEFTYWLFKQRVRSSEPARVASDTRKGLARLRLLRKGQNVGLAGDPGDDLL